MNITMYILLMAVAAVLSVFGQSPGGTPKTEGQNDASCVRGTCSCSESCLTWNVVEQLFTEKSKRVEMENTIKEMKSAISALETQLSTDKKFRCETGQLGKHANPAPSWPLIQTVTFKTAFQEKPTVTYGLYLLDAAYTANLRVVTEAKNVTNTGFQVKLNTWADTTMFGARVSWMACGR
ncbi:uncharacterized protein LOC125682260 [Ostrea edulis]|uniref:uncharacterized protein LOC125682260 n=1 Tax=Ostrea edulis TaxID=37623 RepID=UPI0024AF3EC7|nr:uncharacterized protein LOC125682260 [Ostrea edulis]